MDTNRINIISEDLSQENIPAVETLTGFTVIAAEKGPVEPVFIPAGNTSMVYDVLGYPSAAYPHVQEVLDFNKHYGVYVSAPYDTSENNKVPAAYITPAGVFARKDPITITGFTLESVLDGENDVEGLTEFSQDAAVLIPVGKEKDYFNYTSAQAVQAALTYDAGVSGGLKINFGFEFNDTNLDTLKESLHFLSTETYDESIGRVLKVAGTGADHRATLVFDIPGEDLIELLVEDDGTDYVISDTNKEVICKTSKGEEYFLIDKTSTRGTLQELVAKYFSTGAVASIWSDGSFLSKVNVYWKAKLSADAVKGVIHPKYVSSRVTGITFPKQALGNKLTMNISERTTPKNIATASVTGSLQDQDVDGFGAPLSFFDRLANQNMINVITIDPFTTNTVYTKTGTTAKPEFIMSPVKLARGVRVVDELEAGWEAAKDPVYDAVEVFFNVKDVTSLDDSVFFSLANTHKLSRFIASCPVAPTAITEELPQLAFGSNYYIITNKFTRRSTFTKENFESPVVGAYAVMIARAIEQKYGGVAPMFVNSGGLGGQLDVTVRKARYKFNKDQLTILDGANYNPIILDPAYGLMVVGQKTAKAGELSDWSYVGHASAFLAFQRECRNLVLIPQIGKANNPYYRELRKQQTETILRPRIEGAERIWAQASVDTSELTVNTKEVQAAKKFVVKVLVKVDIFSEVVELIMTNVDQFTDITRV